MHHLYSVLKSEARLLEKLIKVADLRKFRKLICILKSEFVVENAIIKKIENIQTFKDIFSALVKGEHIIRKMDKAEKRLLKRMQQGVSKIFSNEITEGITYEWTSIVYNKVQDFVMDHEAVMAKGYDPHTNVDFEFVNRPEFIDLVREVIQSIKRRKVSEQMINVFVHLFREWYNHQRD
mgnify:FL=1